MPVRGRGFARFFQVVRLPQFDSVAPVGNVKIFRAARAGAVGRAGSGRTGSGPGKR